MVFYSIDILCSYKIHHQGMHVGEPTNISAWTVLFTTPHSIAVLSGQFSLLRELAASVRLIWGKAEPATRPSRTILHDTMNSQLLVAIARVFPMHAQQHVKCKYTCAMLIDGLG